MSERVDVLVIGAGAIGVCAAMYLQRRGYRVLLLDRGLVGGACSGENAGLIVPSHVVPLAAPGVISQGLRWMLSPGSPFRIKPRLDKGLVQWLWHFRKACTPKRMRRSMPVLCAALAEGRALYEELAGDPEIEFNFERRGLLMLYSGAAGRIHCAEEAKLAQQLGVEVTLLDRAELRKVEPAAPAGSQGGAYYPNDAHLNPRQFVLSAAAWLQQHGGQVREDTEVTRLVRQGETIVRVETSAGNVSPRHVVLANGAWSPLLARELGIRLLVQAGKGYSVTLPIDEPRPRVPMILTEARATITPLDQHLRFAGTLELAGLDHSIDRRRLRGVLGPASEYLPNLNIDQVSNDQVWVGFRPCSPDGLPFIGRPPACENLIVATGHAMLGMSLAPITGLLTAQLVAGEPSSLPLAPFALDRF